MRWWPNHWRFVDHLALGGRGKALHRRYRGLLLCGQFADETRGVQVIGAEIVAPTGQAAGLVEHPGADLALGDGVAEAGVAQLFGRHVEQGDVAEADALQHRAALGWG